MIRAFGLALLVLGASASRATSIGEVEKSDEKVQINSTVRTASTTWTPISYKRAAKVFMAAALLGASGADATPHTEHHISVTGKPWKIAKTVGAKSLNIAKGHWYKNRATKASRHHHTRSLPGSETDIRHRYIGTAFERTPRSLQLVPDTGAFNIVALIHEAIEFPGFSEGQQQEILEFSTIRVIEHLVKSLPNEYLRLVHSGHTLSKPSGKALQKNLQSLALEVPMPYLDDQDKKRVCHCISAVITMQMISSDAAIMIGDFDDHTKKKLLFSVFVRGIMEKFFDPDERREMISSVTDLFQEFMPVPTSVLNKPIGYAVKLVGDVIFTELEETFDLYLDAAKERDFVDVIPNGYSGCSVSAEELEDCKSRPFHAMLKCRMCNQLDERITVIGVVCRLMPARMRARVMMFLMDKVLHAVTFQKLEDTMSMVVRPFGGAPPLRLQAPGSAVGSGTASAVAAAARQRIGGAVVVT